MKLNLYLLSLCNILLISFVASQNATTTNEANTTALATPTKCNETNNEEYVSCIECQGTCQTAANFSNSTPTPGCACKSGYLLNEVTKECMTWDEAYSKCNTTSDGLTVIIITHIITYNISLGNDTIDAEMQEYGGNGTEAIMNATLIPELNVTTLANNENETESNNQTETTTTVSSNNVTEGVETTTTAAGNNETSNATLNGSSVSENATMNATLPSNQTLDDEITVHGGNKPSGEFASDGDLNSQAFSELGYSNASVHLPETKQHKEYKKNGIVNYIKARSKRSAKLMYDNELKSKLNFMVNKQMVNINKRK